MGPSSVISRSYISRKHHITWSNFVLIATFSRHGTNLQAYLTSERNKHASGYKWGYKGPQSVTVNLLCSSLYASSKSWMVLSNNNSMSITISAVFVCRTRINRYLATYTLWDLFGFDRAGGSGFRCVCGPTNPMCSLEYQLPWVSLRRFWDVRLLDPNVCTKGVKLCPVSPRSETVLLIVRSPWVST